MLAKVKGGASLAISRIAAKRGSSRLSSRFAPQEDSRGLRSSRTPSGGADTALQVEAAVIDALGLPFLTNQVRGWRSSRYGRTPLGELIALYRRRPVRIQEPSILIRITELYRPQMTASELYDATRASWKLGQKRQLARYAFAVFEGVVREVYEITQWFQAGSTFNSRDPHGVRSPDRWEFVGRLAPEGVRRRYINRDVSSYFKRGNQNPISYVKIR